MKVVAVIPVRSASERLPEKWNLRFGNRTMLEVVYDRVKQALVDEIWIATTTDESDNVVAEFCISKEYKFDRGSPTNVYSRLVNIAKKSDADIIINVDGEQPLVKPQLIDYGVVIVERGTVDCIGFSRCPAGFAPNFVCTAKYLLGVAEKKDTNIDYHWGNLLNADYDYCVDTMEDYEKIKKEIEK